MTRIETPDGTYPFFVYGTLRPGQSLWPWMRPAVHNGRAWVAYARGYRLAMARYGDYPVLLETAYRPENKFVRGTFVHVRMTEDFQDIWQMEVRSGYRADSVPVYSGNPDGAISFMGNAMAFVWPSLNYGDLLAPTFYGERAVYDFALRPQCPGPEEVESIPARRPNSNG